MAQTYRLADLVSLCDRILLVGPAEVGAIDPHAVKDDGKLARQRDPCLLGATPPGAAIPQAFRVENRTVRVSITLAAS